MRPAVVLGLFLASIFNSPLAAQSGQVDTKEFQIVSPKCRQEHDGSVLGSVALYFKSDKGYELTPTYARTFEQLVLPVLNQCLIVKNGGKTITAVRVDHVLLKGFVRINRVRGIRGADGSFTFEETERYATKVTSPATVPNRVGQSAPPLPESPPKAPQTARSLPNEPQSRDDATLHSQLNKPDSYWASFYNPSEMRGIYNADGRDVDPGSARFKTFYRAYVVLFSRTCRASLPANAREFQFIETSQVYNDFGPVGPETKSYAGSVFVDPLLAPKYAEYMGLAPSSDPGEAARQAMESFTAPLRALAKGGLGALQQTASKVLNQGKDVEDFITQNGCNSPEVKQFAKNLLALASGAAVTTFDQAALTAQAPFNDFAAALLLGCRYSNSVAEARERASLYEALTSESARRQAQQAVAAYFGNNIPGKLRARREHTITYTDLLGENATKVERSCPGGAVLEAELAKSGGLFKAYWLINANMADQPDWSSYQDDWRESARQIAELVNKHGSDAVIAAAAKAEAEGGRVRATLRTPYERPPTNCKSGMMVGCFYELLGKPDWIGPTVRMWKQRYDAMLSLMNRDQVKKLLLAELNGSAEDYAFLAAAFGEDLLLAAVEYDLRREPTARYGGSLTKRMLRNVVNFAAALESDDHFLLADYANSRMLRTTLADLVKEFRALTASSPKSKVAKLAHDLRVATIPTERGPYIIDPYRLGIKDPAQVINPADWLREALQKQ